MVLVIVVGLMIANTEVSALVVIVVKIGRDIVLGIGQVIENGPVAGLECPGFFKWDHKL